MKEPYHDFCHLDKLSFKDAKIKKRITAALEKQMIPQSQLDLGLRFKREIETNALPAVSIRWISEQVGCGLFAEQEIEADAFVGEYIGVLRKNDAHSSADHYLYEYPVLDEIGRNYVIDAKKGNLVRFINHSDNPNLKPHYAFVNGFYHLLLLSIRPIAKDEQLTYNYGKTYWYVRTPPQSL